MILEKHNYNNLEKKQGIPEKYILGNGIVGDPKAWQSKYF